jgi:hypothetical protein
VDVLITEVQHEDSSSDDDRPHRPEEHPVIWRGRGELGFWSRLVGPGVPSAQVVSSVKQVALPGGRRSLWEHASQAFHPQVLVTAWEDGSQDTCRQQLASLECVFEHFRDKLFGLRPCDVESYKDPPAEVFIGDVLGSLNIESDFASPAGIKSWAS